MRGRMAAKRNPKPKRTYGRRTRSHLKFTAMAKSKFWALVHKTSGCWTWIGPLATHGYGTFAFGDLQIMAHRYSWEIANFEIVASRYHVHHLCGKRDCVRPDHLELVTPDEHGKRHKKC